MLFRTFALALVGACLANVASAQLPHTTLESVFPPGAKAGTEVDVVLTGSLEEVDTVTVSHAGITAVQKVDGNKKPIANTFTVKVAGNVPPGRYELRAAGYFGLSNPRVFAVSSRDEIVEKEGNNTKDLATPVGQNQIVNARSNGGADIDWYKFTGTKGQRILVACQAGRIDSKLDPVVEIYNADRRRLVRSARSKVWMHGDPVADVTLPADGEYFIKVRDFVNGGGNPYVYRLEVGTGPWVDYVMPPAGPPGSNQKYTLYGRNLPGGTPAGVEVEGRALQKVEVNIALPKETVLQNGDGLAPVQAGMDGIQYVLNTPVGKSNPVFIAFSTAPLKQEQEPNDTADKSTKVALPAEVAGQFQSRGDVDYIEFEAKAKQVLYVEAYAQRGGTLADPYFIVEQITKAKDGKEQVKRLTAQDDNTANLAVNQFDTNTDDPSWKFAVPADGTYRIAIQDRYNESRGDPRLTYRLAIREESPSFRLAVLSRQVVPNQGANTQPLALRKGQNVELGVMAFRRDGFDGTIEVWAEGLPEGVKCTGAVLGAGVTTAPLIFSAAENAKEWHGTIRVFGKAKVDDPAKARAVTAAEAAVAPAEKALPPLRKNLDNANKALAPVQKQLDQAKAAAAKDAKNKGLQTNLANAQKNFDQKQQAVNTAKAALAAGEKKVADAQAAVASAEAARKASIQEFKTEARSATVVWNGNQTTQTISRVADGIGLSVMKEQIHYQVVTDVHDVTAHQGRQVLVPVKLLKRNKFDNNVKLTFVGLPKNSNITVPTPTIAKGKSEELVRIFVNNNARVGDYTLVMNGQGQVSYQKNPDRTARATQAQKDAAEAVKKATAEANKAKAALAAAAKKLAADNNAVKAAENAKKQAEAQKKSPDEIKKAVAALTAAQATAKASAEANAKADAANKQAAAALAAANNAKKAADAELKSAQAASKAKNINVTEPSTSIVLRVKEAPATLTAAVPSGGNLKKGQKLDVKVTAKRVNGFAGPVTLTLPLPPGVKGLTAAPVTIPADKTEGVISIQAAGDATEGQIENMVVRAEMDFDGKAAVDAPIKIKVNK